jgi:hypothetical protein
MEKLGCSLILVVLVFVFGNFVGTPKNIDVSGGLVCPLQPVTVTCVGGAGCPATFVWNFNFNPAVSIAEDPRVDPAQNCLNFGCNAWAGQNAKDCTNGTATGVGTWGRKTKPGVAD